MITCGLSISTEEIFQLIDVHKPYFALENLMQSEDGSVSAIIPIQQQLGYEPLPITNCEAGRHLAVLGSCAIALKKGSRDRHYYLAAKANTTRLNFENRNPSFMSATAKCLSVDSKSAITELILSYIDGKVFSKSIIDYHIINHKTFERVYKSKVLPMLLTGDNPYIQEPYVEFQTISDTKLTATIDHISHIDCQGHFVNLPAVPISTLFGRSVALAIHLMQVRLNKPHGVFVVKEFTSDARNLAFPGDVIDFEAQFVFTDEKHNHLVKLSAHTNADCCVGEAELILSEVG